MPANQKTELFQNYRMKGAPPTQVPSEVVEPLVDRVMSAPEELLLQISEIFGHSCQEPLHSFNSSVCEKRGELLVADYGRLKNGKKVCIRCAEMK